MSEANNSAGSAAAETPVHVEGTSSNTKKRKLPADFAAKDDWKLISQGAEARIWKIPKCSSSFDRDAIAKERFSKSYRHPVLDERLTKQRCRAEARILSKCREKGKLDVPSVLRVDAPVLYLEYVDGKTMRDSLETVLNTQDNLRVQQLGDLMGAMVAKIHNLGVVHGDLTTSNMMIRSNWKEVSSQITLIDFGLAKNTESAEERAVDLYVLERALLSTHPRLPGDFWETTMKGYEEACTSKLQETLNRLEQVRQRGRKRECFG